MSTPRKQAEIQNGDGRAVLEGKSPVLTIDGQDVTEEFIKGAQEVLNICKALNISEALLKSKSPSCGCGQTYDGTFSGKLTKGDGVTTTLLKRNGVKVISIDKDKRYG